MFQRPQSAVPGFAPSHHILFPRDYLERRLKTPLQSLRPSSVPPATRPDSAAWMEQRIPDMSPGLGRTWNPNAAEKTSSQLYSDTVLKPSAEGLLDYQSNSRPTSAIGVHNTSDMEGLLDPSGASRPASSFSPHRADFTVNASDSHLKQALSLALHILERFEKEGRSMTEDENSFIAKLAAKGKDVVYSYGGFSEKPEPLTSEKSEEKTPTSPLLVITPTTTPRTDEKNLLPVGVRTGRRGSDRMDNLFAKLKSASQSSQIYKEMEASRADMKSLAEFSLMTASTHDVPQLAALLQRELEKISKIWKVSIYVKDAVEDFLVNPLSTDESSVVSLFGKDECELSPEQSANPNESGNSATQKIQHAKLIRSHLREIASKNIAGPTSFKQHPKPKEEEEGAFHEVDQFPPTSFFPIRVGDTFLGVIQIEGLSDVESMDSAKRSHIQAVNGIVAMSFRNLRLFDKITWQREKGEAMLKIENQLARDNLNDEAVLIRSVMETAKQIAESDRCSVFLVQGNYLRAFFDAEGIAVKIPLESGIAGHVAKTGEVVNIEDAYEDSRFNTSVDKATGYRTKSILCVPVHYEENIVAVAQLINKLPKEHGKANFERCFGKRDEELFTTFSAFVGVCLRNCKVNNDLVQEKKKSETILQVVQMLSNTDIRDVNSVSDKILHGAKQLLNADRASLFLKDKERDELYSAVADRAGKEIRFPSGKGIAGTVCMEGKGENIVDAYADSRFNSDFDKQLGYRTQSILCEPITCQGEVLAVAQLVNKLYIDNDVVPFTEADQETFQTFASFAGIALNNAQLLKFAVHAGEEAMALNSTNGVGGMGRQRTSSLSVLSDVSENEITTCANVIISDEFFASFQKRSFDLFTAVRDPNTREGALTLAVRLLFKLIQSTGLPEKFGCPPTVLMKFLLTCKGKYRAVPYHNFFHAVDACQTLYTFLMEGKILEDGLITELECFVLLITAIVHDLDHMGLNNSFHLKTDSPLGILSSASGNNSVLEVHHCNVAIEIMSDPSCNVFCGLDEDSAPKAYRAMIDCVLATDMARHGDLITNFVKMCESDPVESMSGTGSPTEGGANKYNKNNPEHRTLAMQMCLKAADISNVTKPFDIGRRWGIAVTEEFFKQGDKEKEKGVAVLPMFDRSQNTELAKSQIGFINFLGKKFFSTIVGKLFTKLQWTVDNVEANLAEWQKQLEVK